MGNLGKIMIVLKLSEIVERLGSLDPENTIYATEPWSCDSLAVVAREPDDGGVPPEAAHIAASYFLEVFIAMEFLEDWQQYVAPRASRRELCERLIAYAVNDA